MTAVADLTFEADAEAGEPQRALLEGGLVRTLAAGEVMRVVTRPAEVIRVVTLGRMAGVDRRTGGLRRCPVTGAELQSTDGGLLSMNPPALTWYRQRINPLFTPAAVRRQHERAGQVVADLLATLQAQAGRGRPVIDLMADYVTPGVASLVTMTMGLPRGDWDLVQETSRVAFGRVRHRNDIARTEATWDGLYGYYRRRLGQREGLVAAVTAALEGATPEQISHVLATVSNGFPAVLFTIARVITEFLRHPDLIRQCLAGPLSWAGVIAVIMKRRALFPVDLPRWAPEGTTVDGEPVPEGTLLLPSLVAAGRAGAPDTIPYGAGPHFCPGAAYAKDWTLLAVVLFFLAFPAARLDGPLTWLPGTLQVAQGPAVRLT